MPEQLPVVVVMSLQFDFVPLVVTIDYSRTLVAWHAKRYLIPGPMANDGRTICGWVVGEVHGTVWYRS